MEHQTHFGKKFYQDKQKGYWISTTEPRIRAHVWVWKSIHGNIPKGYHIHHRDENKSNNSIENLELIHSSRHLSIHSSKPENKERARKRAEKIRPLTKEWHRSKEGRKWHSEHAIRCNFGNGEYFDYKCFECKKPYRSKVKAENRSKFCCNACKSRWRRKMGFDEIDKICPVCNKNYRSNKYSRSKTCGKTCGQILKDKID
jgi:hypothetical protein